MAWSRVLTVIVLLAGLALTLAITPHSALADSIVVTDASASYPCTRDGLAGAIADASTTDPNNPGIVTFDCESPTITFAAGDVITITDVVTIDGSNDGNAIILDGNHTSNFFLVTDDADLTVTQVTMQKGRNDTIDEGGAIDVDGGGTLTFIGVSFIDNQAAIGGAIDHENGILTISQTSFIDNQADIGGAIWSGGTLTISQSSFVNNHATYHGGAIDLSDSSAEITTSTFSGNTAVNEGSTVVVHTEATSTNISWSTIVQPANANPALNLGGDLTLTGVILGGDGNHCAFDGGSLTTSFTLANDDSCVQGSTADWENQALLLAPLSTATINGIDQTYYPLAEHSPAIDAGPASCDTNILEGTNPDQLGTPRPVGDACDIGAIEWLEPTVLCANPWNGQLSMASRNGCGRSETLIELPQYAGLTICVNNWNGTTRVSDDCSRSEHAITVIGNDTTPICVNNWNNTIRVSNRCTRSEHPDRI